MPKVISEAFKAHLQQETTELCTCWKATLTNGWVLGFTDHTRDLTIDEVVYRSATGFTPASIESSAALNVDNLEIEAILSSPMISEQDLMSGLWDYASIDIFWVIYSDLSAGVCDLKSGTLGEVTVKQSTFVAEVRGLTQAYTNAVGELFSTTCRAKRLGDERCQLNMAGRTVEGVVDRASPDNAIFYDSRRTEPGPTGSKAITGISRAQFAVLTVVAHGLLQGQIFTVSGVMGVTQDGAFDVDGVFHNGSHLSINGSLFVVQEVIDADHISIRLDTRLYDEDPDIGQSEAELVYSEYVSGGIVTPQGASSTFDYGILTWTSGRNIGLRMEVKAYLPGVVALQLPMSYPITPGDTYILEEGCDRAFSTCVTRFDNGLNFQGEPHLPGQDQIAKIGTVG